jgi:hypothetical protein
MISSFVIPAKAGTQLLLSSSARVIWAPAIGHPSKYYFDGNPAAGVTMVLYV